MMKKNFVLAILIFLGCSTHESSTTKTELNPVVLKSTVIDLTNLKQVIDGFGAATVWNGQLSDQEMDLAFLNGPGQLGLTICRIRFDPNGNDTHEILNSRKAKERGAIILASVWSPPPKMKNNDSVVGGSIKDSSFGEYASWLSNNRVKFGNVDIVSIQNEPNIEVNYESCSWTKEQILNFCKNYANKIGGNVMIPECYNFDVSYSDLVLNNPTASYNINYIGGHIYGSSPFYYSNAIAKGKKVWMTEHYYDPDDIQTCLNMAKEISDCMYYHMNAYVWWYLKEVKCNLIDSKGNIKKKGYIMAQFSKFVRPGYHRVHTIYNMAQGVYFTAYKGDKMVLIIVNKNNYPVSFNISFQNGIVKNFTKYVTSAVKNLKKEEDVVLVTNNSLNAVVDALSVTTFVETDL